MEFQSQKKFHVELATRTQQCRTSYNISGGSLHSRNNANRRYNAAIEAQKQKECHPFFVKEWF